MDRRPAGRMDGWMPVVKQRRGGGGGERERDSGSDYERASERKNEPSEPSEPSEDHLMIVFLVVSHHDLLHVRDVQRESFDFC
jgi:hypothetical protein